MNTLMRIALVTVLVSGLVACASMDRQSSRAAPQSAPLDAKQQYMSVVEKIASRRGVRVMWVNPPLSPDAKLLAGE